MNSPISLKSAEHKVFQTSFADGLWDMLLGCFALEFAIAPLLSEYLGDFWSSVVFLPFWGLVFLIIWLLRKHVVKPRIGSVRFGKARKAKLRKFSMVMLVANAIVFIFGLLAFFAFESGRFLGGSPLPFLGLFLLTAFSMAAHLLDFPRLYVYGLLLFLTPLTGEWLYQNHGAAHHGFPIVFGITAGVMILTGLILFIRLLINNPPVELPDEGEKNA